MKLNWHTAVQLKKIHLRLLRIATKPRSILLCLNFYFFLKIITADFLSMHGKHSKCNIDCLILNNLINWLFYYSTTIVQAYSISTYYVLHSTLRMEKSWKFHCSFTEFKAIFIGGQSQGARAFECKFAIFNIHPQEEDIKLREEKEDLSSLTLMNCTLSGS